MRSKYAIAAAVAAVLCGLWRLYQFGQTELTSDQAFITQWIIGLADAERFFPAPGDGGWLARLMGDEESFLNVLLRQLYQAQVLIFVTVSVALYTLYSFAFGASMESIVAVSIACSAIWLWLIAMYPVLCRAGTGLDRAEARALGGIALALGCGSSFFNVFSAMGPHNAGVMFLVLSAAVTQCWIRRVGDAGNLRATGPLTLAMFAVQWLAIYAHYTNVFLLPAATVFALAIHPALSVRRRTGLVVRYAAISLIGFVPAIALAFAYSEAIGGTGNTQTFAGLTSNLVLSDSSVVGATMGERVALWFRDIGGIYTLPGLLLGIAGAAGMAWRHRLAFPLAVILVHFLCGAFLQIFTQYDRTGAYILPMLMLGGAWCIATAAATLARWPDNLRSRRGALFGGAAVAVMAATLAHAIAERERLATPQKTLFWGRTIGPPVWRPVVAEIDALVPDGAMLVPWNYGLSHQYRATTGRRGQGAKPMRPLETLISHREAGTLASYISRRKLDIPPDAPLFLLAPGDISATEAGDLLRAVTGPDGFGLPAFDRLETVGAWTLPRFKYGKRNLRLYRAIRNRPG